MTDHADGEVVYVESDWWDGPRSGLADVQGQPHYFQSVEDFYLSAERDTQYRVWPVSPEVLALEVEQYQIFLAWRARFDAGTETTDTHPTNGGDARYDAIENLVAAYRVPPDTARQVIAEWQFGPGTDDSRPGYRVRWQ